MLLLLFVLTASVGSGASRPESCAGPNKWWCEAKQRCMRLSTACRYRFEPWFQCDDAGFAEACVRYCTETQGFAVCRDGICIREHQMCDGYRNCRDGSDEERPTCERLCAEKTDHVLCENNECLSKKDYCLDRGCKADVPAGFCEDICSRDDVFRCNASSGSGGPKCVYGIYVCNGYPGCPGGEDQTRSACEAKCKSEGKIVCEAEAGCCDAAGA